MKFVLKIESQAGRIDPPMNDILTLDQSSPTLLKLQFDSTTNRDYGYDPETQHLLIEAHLMTGDGEVASDSVPRATYKIKLQIYVDCAIKETDLGSNLLVEPFEVYNTHEYRIGQVVANQASFTLPRGELNGDFAEPGLCDMTLALTIDLVDPSSVWLDLAADPPTLNIDVTYNYEIQTTNGCLLSDLGTISCEIDWSVKVVAS